jgi:ribonucleoside-triphosphate reductase (formate)
MNVIKRDGKVEAFDFNKPFNALEKVYKNGLKIEVPTKLKEKFNEKLDEFVHWYQAYKSDENLNIEKIQDFIRDFLMDNGERDAAEQFIIYRDERSNYREANTKLQKNIGTKLYAKNVVNQNANLDEESFGGRIGEAASEVCKDYALKHSMSKKSRRNHEQNMIYQHDLNSFAVGMSNCLTHPIDPILEHGFQVKQCDVRPASSLNTAFQLLAVNFQIQSLQQFGGVSTGHLDWTMVPYFRKSFYKHYINWCNGIPGCKFLKPNIKKEEIKHISVENSLYKSKYNLLKKMVWQRAWDSTIKELNQAAEAFYHNMNSLQSRSGNQLPFSSINYGTCTLPEGRAITNALLDATIAGTGKYHRTSIFPCVIFQYSKDIHGTKENPGPNYDLFRKALTATVKRDYPNYCNVDWSTNLDGNKYDRKMKNIALSMIDNSTYNRLYNWLIDNPSYQEFLSLEPVRDGKLPLINVKDYTSFSRYEVMSTMGKRNTTAHLKPFEPCLMGVAA